MLAARERYEAKHSGNFTRIYPSPDPAKQALYEELLRVGSRGERSYKVQRRMGGEVLVVPDG